MWNFEFPPTKKWGITTATWETNEAGRRRLCADGIKTRLSHFPG